MSLRTYAYRVGRVVDLLDDEEWDQIGPLLRDRIKSLMKYRMDHGCSLDDARKYEPLGQSALDRYEEMTGLRLDHPDQLFGIRMRDYGSLCPQCSSPFRTPRAKMCAECGYVLPEGELAGELCNSAT